jgi:hypothetical protein
MDLIDEEDTWHDVGLAFFPPLGHLLIDLFSHFLSDLSSSAGEEGQKSLGARVDHIDLVQGDGVHHLLALLDLAFRAVHESGLRTHGIVV